MSIVNVRKENLRKLGFDDLDDWLKDPNHIYIGRDMSFYVKGAIGSKWQNPYSVKKYGRESCLKMYENYALKNLINDIHELDGKVLGCWCHPEPCHGDILLKLLNKN